MFISLAILGVNLEKVEGKRRCLQSIELEYLLVNDESITLLQPETPEDTARASCLAQGEEYIDWQKVLTGGKNRGKYESLSYWFR
jgi:hypothetical protein